MSLVKRIASLSVSTGIVFNNFPLTVFCKKIKFIQYTAKTTTVHSKSQRDGA